MSCLPNNVFITRLVIRHSHADEWYTVFIFDDEFKRFFETWVFVSRIFETRLIETQVLVYISSRVPMFWSQSLARAYLHKNLTSNLTNQNKQMNRHKDKRTDIKTNEQTLRQTIRHWDKWTNRRTNKQTKRNDFFVARNLKGEGGVFYRKTHKKMKKCKTC